MRSRFRSRPPRPARQFLVRLLQRYGDEPRLAEFYVNALLEAFPAFEDDAIETTLTMLRLQIEFLTLERFARPLGLVTLEDHVQDPKKRWDRSWIVTATPLAYEVVRFEV